MLANIERSGYTISRKKSHFYTPTLEVVGYIYGIDRRMPIDSHVKTITNWLECKNLKELRGFLRVYTYY